MLQAGIKAPHFKLPNQKGELRDLNDFIGQKVVLYFYPKDNTPGCTTQACSYRDRMGEFADRNVKVFGISKDDLKSHQKFESDFDLNFELLSDEQLEAIKAYDVWVEKNMYGNKSMGIARTTYVIDSMGIIAKVFEKVDPKLDTQLVLDAIDHLG